MNYDKKRGELVGKRVLVNSYRVSHATGTVTSYIPRGHHYWVKLDKPYKTKSGKMSVYHKCNAGNCAELNK